MVSSSAKSAPVSIRSRRKDSPDAEERSLARLNKLFAKAAPKAARETRGALARFHRDIAATIRRAR